MPTVLRRPGPGRVIIAGVARSALKRASDSSRFSLASYPPDSGSPPRRRCRRRRPAAVVLGPSWPGFNLLTVAANYGHLPSEFMITSDNRARARRRRCLSSTLRLGASPGRTGSVRQRRPGSLSRTGVARASPNHPGSLGGAGGSHGQLPRQPGQGPVIAVSESSLLGRRTQGRVRVHTEPDSLIF
jgi:hypothetical protein